MVQTNVSASVARKNLKRSGCRTSGHRLTKLTEGNYRPAQKPNQPRLLSTCSMPLPNTSSFVDLGEAHAPKHAAYSQSSPTGSNTPPFSQLMQDPRRAAPLHAANAGLGLPSPVLRHFSGV